MKVRFWGVRGSFAMSGSAFIRYGGNTTAIEVRNSDGNRLLIDLGTGVTAFAAELMKAEFGTGKGRLPVLLTHTHLDHIQGLPFFSPFFIKGNQIDIYGPDPEGEPLANLLQDQLNPHYSPLYGLENLAAGVTINGINPETELSIDGFEVEANLLPHGSMAVLGFRVTADGKTAAFLTDVEYPSTGPTREALALADGADLLVHDSMFDDEEYASRRGWGHSPVSGAIAVAERAKVGSLALFHHSPDSTDAVIDALQQKARRLTKIPVFAASENEPVEL